MQEGPLVSSGSGLPLCTVLSVVPLDGVQDVLSPRCCTACQQCCAAGGAQTEVSHRAMDEALCGWVRCSAGSSKRHPRLFAVFCAVCWAATERSVRCPYWCFCRSSLLHTSFQTSPNQLTQTHVEHRTGKFQARCFLTLAIILHIPLASRHIFFSTSFIHLFTLISDYSWPSLKEGIKA